MIMTIQPIQRGQRTQGKIPKGDHLGDLRPSQSLLIARVSLKMIHVTIHMSTNSTQTMSLKISQRIPSVFQSLNLAIQVSHLKKALILNLMMTLDRLTTLKTILKIPSPMRILPNQVTSTFLSIDSTHTGRNPRTKNP